MNLVKVVPLASVLAAAGVEVAEIRPAGRYAKRAFLAVDRSTGMTA